MTSGDVLVEICLAGQLFRLLPFIFRVTLLYFGLLTQPCLMFSLSFRLSLLLFRSSLLLLRTPLPFLCLSQSKASWLSYAMEFTKEETSNQFTAGLEHRARKSSTQARPP